MSVGPILKLTGSVMKATTNLAKFEKSTKGASKMVGILTGKISPSTIVLGKFGNFCKSSTTKVASLAKHVKAVGFKRFAQEATAVTKLNVGSAFRSIANSIKALPSRLSMAVTQLKLMASVTLRATAMTIKSTAANIANAVSTSRIGTACSSAGTPK